MSKHGIRELSRASALRTCSGAGGGRPCLVREQHTFSIVCYYGTVTVSRLPKRGTLQRLCLTRSTSVACLASSPVFYVPTDQDCSFYCQNECPFNSPTSVLSSYSWESQSCQGFLLAPLESRMSHRSQR